MRDAVRNKERRKATVRLPKILVLTGDVQDASVGRACGRGRQQRRVHEAGGPDTPFEEVQLAPS